eukprot:11155972-Heterocapsa_arctica.AAC.1
MMFGEAHGYLPDPAVPLGHTTTPGLTMRVDTGPLSNRSTLMKTLSYPYESKKKTSMSPNESTGRMRGRARGLARQALGPREGEEEHLRQCGRARQALGPRKGPSPYLLPVAALSALVLSILIALLPKSPFLARK